MTATGFAFADEVHVIETTGTLIAASQAKAFNAVQKAMSEACADAKLGFQASDFLVKGGKIEAYIRAHGSEFIRTHNRKALNDGGEVLEGDHDSIVERLIQEILGMGGIDTILAMDDVEDITINGPFETMIKQHGIWKYYPDLKYEDSASLLSKINQGIAHTGQKAGSTTPIVDSVLRSGNRINIVTYPLAEPWPVISIRKRMSSSLGLTDMVSRGRRIGQAPPLPEIPDFESVATADGTMSAAAALFLHCAAIAGFNILVIGKTGTGKSSLLNAIGKAIPPWRRILCIEDTRELQIRPPDSAGRPFNCVYFTTRPESLEGMPAIRQDQLVKAALRQRPDALAIGEVRGGEIFDLIQSLATGHRNGLTSIHAESIEEVPQRMKMMFQQSEVGRQFSESTVADLIAKSFHIALFINVNERPERLVEHIAEYTGATENGNPVRNPLFQLRGDRLELTTKQLRHQAMWLEARLPPFSEMFGKYYKY